LSDPYFLVHFNLTRLLYLKINALNERRFGIIVFYLKTNYKVLKDLAKIASTVV
jgi:hypothetical protein